MLNESILSFSKIWSLYFSCFYSFPNKLGKDEKWKYEKTQRISGCSLALAHMKLLSLQGKIPSQEKKNVKSILKFFSPMPQSNRICVYENSFPFFGYCYDSGQKHFFPSSNGNFYFNSWFTSSKNCCRMKFPIEKSICTNVRNLKMTWFLNFIFVECTKKLHQC